jgi:AMP-binding enzyme C-terminal domain/Phosphopantetheine attachment site
VRGFLIDPVAVETVLDAQSFVLASAVTAEPDSTGEARLLAYVVPAAAGPVPVGELRDHVAASLPAHFVPSVFVPVEQLPRTRHGKLDRSGLPPPPSPVPPAPAVLPGSALERRIAEIWRDVLDLDEVGLDDSFFNLGGTSLSITVVRAMLAECSSTRPSAPSPRI